MVNFIFHIYLKVKFRAFFMDFGTTEKKFQLSYDGTDLGYAEIDVAVPEGAKKVFDKKGITLKVW